MVSLETELEAAPMPATTKAINTNRYRIRRGDSETLKAILAEAEHRHRDLKRHAPDAYAHRVWEDVIKEADEKKIADQIPGTVGYTFKVKYGRQGKPGRPPAHREVRLGSKQVELVDNMDLPEHATLDRVGKKLVFRARTPVVRAVRSAARSAPDSKSRESLDRLLKSVLET